MREVIELKALSAASIMIDIYYFCSVLIILGKL